MCFFEFGFSHTYVVLKYRVFSSALWVAWLLAISNYVITPHFAVIIIFSI